MLSNGSCSLMHNSCFTSLVQIVRSNYVAYPMMCFHPFVVHQSNTHFKHYTQINDVSIVMELWILVFLFPLPLHVACSSHTCLRCISWFCDVCLCLYSGTHNTASCLFFLSQNTVQILRSVTLHIFAVHDPTFLCNLIQDDLKPGNAKRDIATFVVESVGRDYTQARDP
eukprot:167979_1